MAVELGRRIVSPLLKVAMVRRLFAIVGGLCIAGSVYAQPLWQADFSQVKGSGQSWLQSQDFELQRDAEDIGLEIKEGKLVFTVQKETLGLFSKETKINGASKLKIKWGVLKYPQKADWEKGVLREAVSVVLTFGSEKIDSGSFAVPNVPYFISFFLGEKEQEGKPYKGNFYQKGGRYFCIPCKNPVGKTVTTEVNFSDLFKKEFGKNDVPPITGLAIEIDTRDTEGAAQAFIESIEILP